MIDLMPVDPIYIVRANVERLMKLHGIDTQIDLAERAGVNQSTIQKLLKAEPPTSTKLSTLEGVVVALRVAVWQLLMPNLPVGSASVDALRGGLSKQALDLAALYQALPAVAQEQVKGIAEYQASRNKVAAPILRELEREGS